MTRQGPREPPIGPRAGGPPLPTGLGDDRLQEVVARAGSGGPGRSSPSRANLPPKPIADRPHDDLAEQAIKTAPPWLLSAVFHMSLMILLGALLLPSRPDTRIRLEAAVYAEQLGDQLDFESPLAGDDRDESDDSAVTAKHVLEVDNPFAAPPEMEIRPDGHTATSTINAPTMGVALLGRNEGMKRSLRGRYGGTDTTEAAVQLGLKWLARNQIKSTGAWSLTGPYRNGGAIENDSAATAMALMAFLGNGHTHQGKTEYTDNVRRALNWLLGQQDANGNFFHDGGFNHRFYTQAQCTIVVCELLAMTRDESLREPCKKAVEYLLDCQSDLGGWKYRPQGSSDVSVTGWVVMALQSAR
ncbi:MAG: terpene cyclase/mutase family protein, partial [Pirellulales bacterium]|nr:terpene cyclase/mutase family protein [Pirellulales bacterium]